MGAAMTDVRHLRRFRHLTVLALLVCAMAPAPAALPPREAAEVTGLAAEAQGQGEQAVAVRGRVTDGGGEPLAGATVRVAAEGHSAASREMRAADWIAPLTATSDGDGGFAVRARTGESFDVRVEAAGRAPVTVRGIPRGAWLSLHALPGHTLAGNVRRAADGRPVAGALVVACDADALDFGRQACLSVTAAADGSFAFEGLPVGTVELRAHGPGFAASPLVPLELPGEGERIVFLLEPGAAVSGRVVDQQQAPVRAVRVFARPLARGPNEPAVRHRSWPVLPTGSE